MYSAGWAGGNRVRRGEGADLWENLRLPPRSGMAVPGRWTHDGFHSYVVRCQISEEKMGTGCRLWEWAGESGQAVSRLHPPPTSRYLSLHRKYASLVCFPELYSERAYPSCALRRTLYSSVQDGGWICRTWEELVTTHASRTGMSRTSSDRKRVSSTIYREKNLFSRHGAA
jgi:hypothetical protein